MLSGGILMLLGYFWDPFMIIGIIVALSCLIPHTLFNKCPHCGTLFGRNEGQYCQHCGEKID